MRAIFLLLVAANLALFAWFAATTRPPTAPPTPNRRAGRSARKASACCRARNWRGCRGKPIPAKPRAGGRASARAAERRCRAGACIEWGGFAVAEAPRPSRRSRRSRWARGSSQRRSEETAGWWVFIPPQGNRAAALKKTAELKSLGIDDYFILQDEGKMRWAVSLGVFSSEEAAKNRLEALRAKGVRSAQTGERDTQVAKIWFQVRGADAALQAKLREIAQGFARHRSARLPLARPVRSLSV